MKRHRDVMASSFVEDAQLDDESPMNGLGNLADCMLVVVCGLMVAFLVKYNVFDTSTYNQVEPTGEKVAVEQSPQEASASSDGGGKSSYKKLGTLYQDEKTGEMYYLVDGDEGK